MTVAGVSSAMKTDLNLAELIVYTLRSYGRPIPIAFLGRELGQQPSVINEYVELLEQEKVVKRVGPEREEVTLVAQNGDDR